MAYNFDNYRPRLEKLKKEKLLTIIKKLIDDYTEIHSWTDEQIEDLFYTLIN